MSGRDERRVAHGYAQPPRWSFKIGNLAHSSTRTTASAPRLHSYPPAQPHRLPPIGRHQPLLRSRAASPPRSFRATRGEQAGTISYDESAGCVYLTSNGHHVVKGGVCKARDCSDAPSVAGRAKTNEDSRAGWCDGGGDSGVKDEIRDRHPIQVANRRVGQEKKRY